MRAITPEEKKILDDHKLWFETRFDGATQGARADLQEADLQEADLQGADLQRAYLQGAYLQGAYLQGADLQEAYLQRADLQEAYLQEAYLRGAYLQGADLQEADLQGADLQRADLQRADLQRADLRGADLQRADLRGANLLGASIDEDTKFPDFQICPEKGAFIAWKKVRGAILELQIPASAKRTSSLVGRKCRASKARVVKAHGCIEGETKFQSQHDPNFIWTVGEMHEVTDFSDDIRIECAPGLHFFITRKEAESY